MCPAQSRRALHELKPIGQKDAQQRPVLDVEQSLDRSPVGGHALNRSRAPANSPVSHAQLVRARTVGELHDDASGTMRRSAPARARCAHAASARCSRSRSPRAGSTSPRRSGRAPPSRPRPERPRPERSVRKSRSCTLTTRTRERSSHVEANRHDQVYEVARIRRFDQARAQRTDQLQYELVRFDALKPVAQELRVEADLKRLAVEGNRDRLAGPSDVGGLRRDRSACPR